MSWAIKQRWSHVLFLNWVTDAVELQKEVPFPLDTWNGKAILSLVPFYMDRVQFKGFPRLPFFSSLWELNLRTYVNVDGTPGIYFFTLETGHVLANFIARNFYGLPYQYSSIQTEINESCYRLTSSTVNLDVQFVDRAPTDEDGFQKWITERYHVFLKRRGITCRGDVDHEPWSVRPVVPRILKGRISIIQRLPDGSELLPSFAADSLEVRFSRFKPQDDHRLRYSNSGS